MADDYESRLDGVEKSLHVILRLLLEQRHNAGGYVFLSDDDAVKAIRAEFQRADAIDRAGGVHG